MGGALSPITMSLEKRGGEGDLDIETRGEEGHVNMEAQAKEYLGLPGTRRDMGGFFPRAFEGSTALLTLQFQTS